MLWCYRCPPCAHRIVRIAAIVVGLLVASSAIAAGPLTIDRERSSVVAVTKKSGLLGFLGHRHAILATVWSVSIAYDATDASRSSVDLRVPVRQLEIDSPRALEIAALSSSPEAKTVREVQAKMLGPKVLDAARYPEIAFHSTAVEPRSASQAVVHGELALHGRSSKVAIPVRVTRPAADRMRFSGEFTVKQTDYGIEPESIVGVVKVADEVLIRFDVLAVMAGEH